MQKVHQIPQWLQKNMVLSIPLTMILGFLFGTLFDPAFLSKLVVPFTFLMVFPSMLTLNFQALAKGKDYTLQASAQALNFLLLPAIAWGMGYWFFANDPALRLALFLTALLPTSGMTISWTAMTKGNLPSAVKMTLIGLITGSLLAPFYMQLAFGKSLDVPLTKTLWQVVQVVFLPLFLGFMIQKLWTAKVGVEAYQKLKPLIGPWGTLGVLGVIFSAIALKAKALGQDPSLLVVLGIPVLAFYLINFGVSTALAKLFAKRADGIAFIYGTALRNLSIALAIIMALPDLRNSHAAMLVSVAFIFQSQLAAWHAKYIAKLLPENNPVNFMQAGKL